jgi:hypothetical protein
VIILALLSMTVAAANPVRSEVPIKEVVLSDGTRRYTIPLTVAGHNVDAGLDTGSVGLRVLPDAAEGAKPTGSDRVYSYGAGTELEGPEAKAVVAVGDVAAPIDIQAVRSIGCTRARQNCPASKLSPAQFGIQGDGLPGEGFRAIMGTGLGHADLPNPLGALGVRRWIVELPRPGEVGAGRLILNPSEQEVAGFVSLALTNKGRDRQADWLRACLSQASDSNPICAPTLIDTGAPGLQVVNERARPWVEGTAGRLIFQEADGASAAAIDFKSGMRNQASHLTFTQDERVSGARIRSGLIAYFAYSVLYDADRGTIAFRARPPYPDGATASVAQAESR